MISRLRVLIYDPAGAAELLSDEELQAFLDENKVYISNERLQAMGLTGAGYATQFYARGVSNLDDDSTIVNDLGTQQTITTADPINAVFTLSQPVYRWVFLSGASYDLYGAAVGALGAMQARSADAVTYQHQNTRFSLSDRSVNYATLIKQYERKMRPKYADLQSRDS